MASFDPENVKSWYFKQISRQDATDILMSEHDSGVFLVRDSSSIRGDYVLCVKEDAKVCHYIINKINRDNESPEYKIGDRVFTNLPQLLDFYKRHYLDSTPLVRPALRRIEKCIAMHDFDGKDQEDLPFKKGEILTIVKKNEENWWTARNSLGKLGAIPVPYVKPYDERFMEPVCDFAPDPEPLERAKSDSKPRLIEASKSKFARVKQSRVPNAYDETALKLDIDDIIQVTKHNISGQWEGEIIYPLSKAGKSGHFPFTHVEVVNDQDLPPEIAVNGTDKNSEKEGD